MKYNLSEIMRRAWSLRGDRGCTMMTALRIAWAEAKGEKVYTFNVENVRAAISSYLVKLAGAITDIHQQHKYDALREALLLPVDTMGVAVMPGKSVALIQMPLPHAATSLTGVGRRGGCRIGLAGGHRMASPDQALQRALLLQDAYWFQHRRFPLSVSRISGYP